MGVTSLCVIAYILYNAHQLVLQVSIELNEAVSLTYACHFMGFFVKATPLADRVSMSLKADHPMALEYPIGTVGHLRYHLAPKVDEAD